MTKVIPFHDVIAETTIIKRVIRGKLPSISLDARMSLIQALSSLVTQCWSIDPNKRPTAEDCRKSISWLVSLTIARASVFPLEPTIRLN